MDSLENFIYIIYKEDIAINENAVWEGLNMKKILIGLLFVWIITFSVIGYTKMNNDYNEETIKNDTSQSIIVKDT